MRHGRCSGSAERTGQQKRQVFNTCLGRDIILKPSPSSWLCMGRSSGSMPNPKRRVLFMRHCSQGRSSRVSAMGDGDLSPPRQGEAKLLGDWIPHGATTVLAEQHCQVFLWGKQLFLVLSQMLNTSAVPSMETLPMDTTTRHAKGNTEGHALETRQSGSVWRLSAVTSHPRSSLHHLSFLNSR